MTIDENDHNVIVIEDEKEGFKETECVNYEGVVEKSVVIEVKCKRAGCSSSVPFSTGFDNQQQAPIGCAISVKAPSFLTKTFDMVEDPQTNNLISWNFDGESFIVWDHNMFARELLPKYFKHNHLSSFIYQLNNYGFRKIEHDRWEYYHKCFRAGQPQLLESIKRRVPSCKKKDEAAKLMHVEIFKLKNQNNILRMEMEKVKQKQDDIEVCINKVQETLDYAVESFKTPLVVLLHEFMDKLTRDKREPEEAENVNAKKPRLVEPKQELEVATTSQMGLFSTESFEGLLLGDSENGWVFGAMNEADMDIYDDQSWIFMDLQNLLANGPGIGGETPDRA